MDLSRSSSALESYVTPRRLLACKETSFIWASLHPRTLGACPVASTQTLLCPSLSRQSNLKPTSSPPVPAPHMPPPSSEGINFPYTRPFSSPKHPTDSTNPNTVFEQSCLQLITNTKKQQPDLPAATAKLLNFSLESIQPSQFKPLRHLAPTYLVPHTSSKLAALTAKDHQ